MALNYLPSNRTAHRQAEAPPLGRGEGLAGLGCLPQDGLHRDLAVGQGVLVQGEEGFEGPEGAWEEKTQRHPEEGGRHGSKQELCTATGEEIPGPGDL